MLNLPYVVSLLSCGSSVTNCPAFCFQIKTSWREGPSNSNAVNKLSPEVKDLLDKMFEVKQVSWYCLG